MQRGDTRQAAKYGTAQGQLTEIATEVDEDLFMKKASLILVLYYNIQNQLPRWTCS